MQETPNYNLPLYEMDDMANLNDGYNGAMNIIDNELKKQEDGLDNKFPLQSSDLDNGIITASKMAANAIDTVNIVNGAVTTDKMEDGSVTGAKIANGTITNDMLADNFTFPSNAIEDGSITRAMLADSAFDSTPTNGSTNLVDSNGIYQAIKDFTPTNPTEISRKMVVIGDSFAELDGVNNALVNNLKRLIGATEVYNFAVGGSGFVAGPTTFSQQLTQAANSSNFDNNDIAYVYIIGNVNDTYIESQSSVLSAISSFVSNAKTTFPNAQIHYCIGDVRRLEGGLKIKYELDVIEHINNLGCYTHNLLGLCEPSLYRTNGEHWNDAGCAVAANYIVTGAVPPNVDFSNINVNQFGEVITAYGDFITVNSVRGYGCQYRTNFSCVLKINQDIARGSLFYFSNSFAEMCMSINSTGNPIVIYAITQNGKPILCDSGIDTASGRIFVRAQQALSTTDEFLYVLMAI